MTTQNHPANGTSARKHANWSARTDRRLIRATGGSERFVLVELTAPRPCEIKRTVDRPQTSPSSSIARARWPG